jgi:hypothetical protein
MSVRDELDELQVATKTANKENWLTGCGLVPDIRLSPADHMALAIHLGTLGDAAPWGRGDQVVLIQNETEKKYGKKTDAYNEAIAARYKELIALYRINSIKTLMNNAWTARAWPFATRWQNKRIGYTHHELMNGLTPVERVHYMELADANGWTAEQLQQELWGRRGATPPGVSVPDMVRVAELLRWAGVPSVITANECSFQTPQGKLIARSDSPITWEVVK